MHAYGMHVFFFTCFVITNQIGSLCCPLCMPTCRLLDCVYTVQNQLPIFCLGVGPDEEINLGELND